MAKFVIFGKILDEICIFCRMKNGIGKIVWSLIIHNSVVCYSTLFSQIMETVEPWYVSKEIIPVIKVLTSHRLCLLC